MTTDERLDIIAEQNRQILTLLTRLMPQSEDVKKLADGVALRKRKARKGAKK